jgi:hypothetical protein
MRHLISLGAVVSAFSFLYGAQGSVSKAIAADGPVGHAEALANDDWQLFDIPAQPLTSALDAYSAVTGLEVFYDGGLSFGSRSATVKGLFPPTIALQALLAGTGLMARRTDANGFTIRAAPPQAAISGPTADRTPPQAYDPYFSTLQKSVSTALCKGPETEPGTEQVLLRLWVGSDGRVLRGEPVSQMRQGVRAAAILRRLQDLWIGPPPQGMPQPIIMVVFPRAPGAPACQSPGHHVPETRR